MGGRAIRGEEATGLRIRAGASCPTPGKRGTRNPTAAPHVSPFPTNPAPPPLTVGHLSTACPGWKERQRRWGRGTHGRAAWEEEDLKAWKRRSDNKGDFLVTGSRGT